MSGSELMRRLEEVVEEWSGQANQRHARLRRRDLAARADERSPARQAAEVARETLLALPESEREAWLEAQSFREDGVFLGCLLLEAAEALPGADRLPLARLAARVAAESDVSGDGAFQAFLDDTLGRAGLMEVRALRRRGQLEAARSLFSELEAGFALEESPRAFWLTLTADRALTAGLLALDEYRAAQAEEQLDRAARIFRIAGTEQDDAELLFARVRLDLLWGRPDEAVDRLVRAAPFEARDLSLARLELVTRAALRTRHPAVVRPLLATWTTELGQPPNPAGPEGKDRLLIAEAALRVLESRPAVALELLAGPVRRFRAEGRLLGSLWAAVVSGRAELALNRRFHARGALAAGVLEHFADLPETPAIREALAEITHHLTRGEVPSAFLDRLDLWLILVENSPGVGMEPQA
jgi:tetratricopeptide (TPR) repeat protein